MSRNGSGGYNLPTNSWNPAVNGVSATAVDWQSIINDIASAMQQSVSADGQTPITGNIQMSNNKLTGLSAGSATGNSLRWEQLFSQGVIANLASASTVDIGAQNTTFINITGTTTITSFGVNYNGPRFLVFAGALTLTHSAALKCPGNANIITDVGATCIAIPNTAIPGWNIFAFQSGVSLAATQSGVQMASYSAAVAGGTANALTGTYTPSITVLPVAPGTISVLLRAASANTTTTPTFSINGLAAKTIVKGDNRALDYADISGAGHWLDLQYDATLDKWVLKNPAKSVVLSTSTQGSFKNLKASSTGLSANVTVTADEVVLESATNTYQTARTVSLTISGASSGANGLDTGALAVSTWYSVWVIWNGTTTAGLLSLSETAPTMPSGYTHKARVGWIRTDSSANKYPLTFKQFGRRVQYAVTVGTNLAAVPIIASGTLGSVTTPTWSAAAVGNFVPVTACAIVLTLGGGSGGTVSIAAPNGDYGAYTSSTNPPPMLTNTSQQNTSHTMLLESTNVYYASTSGGSGYLACSGWEDNI